MAIGPAPHGAWLGWKLSSPPALPCTGGGQSTFLGVSAGPGVRSPFGPTSSSSWWLPGMFAWFPGTGRGCGRSLPSQPH